MNAAIHHTSIHLYPFRSSLDFFSNDTATTEIYTLSLHDALPIFMRADNQGEGGSLASVALVKDSAMHARAKWFFVLLRSEEHTSELQSRRDLVCRLLLEKKKISECQSHTRSGSTRLYPRTVLLAL